MAHPTESGDRFRERALAEARRYGSDPWVLVRELLQNARDAGATSVAFRTSVDAGRSTLSCRDDGRGLTFDEAQRDLFTLYASRKSGRDAGRFGVGFWSVLLLEPTRLVVRSWPRRGAPWEVAWNGALTDGQRATPGPARAGTEVTLELPPREGLSASVFAAAWRHARFLRARDGRTALEVRVDGRVVSSPFELPAPSMAFRRRGLRGVVALSAEPRVELFAKGLLVRTATSLENLVAPGARRAAAPLAAGMAGLSPQFLLDCEDLDLLLSRGDARSDRALDRVLAVARGELERLLDRQLARAGRRRWRLTRARAAGLVAAVGAGAGLAAMAAPSTRLARPPAVAAATSFAAAPIVADATEPEPAAPPAPYRDPRARYAGPILDTLDHAPPEVALRYEPAHLTLHLAVLRIASFDAEGRPQVAREAVAPYEGPPCAVDCVTFAVEAAGPSWTALPVPTGHRLDPESVTVDRRRVRAWAAATGEPLVRLAEQPVSIRYRTGPADDPHVAPTGPSALPAALAPGARALEGVPMREQPAAASRWVRSLVRDSRDAGLALRFASGARRGEDFARTAIELGAGDCDIQNGMVVRLLQHRGVPARLAVGHLGVEGRAIPGLHAWVEHRADGRRWRIEDASGLESVAPAAPLSPPRAIALSSAAVVPGETMGAAILVGAGLLGAGVVAFGSRPRRRFQLAPTLDVAGLLRGALRSPEAAARMPGLHERTLIPRFEGGRVSLAEAQRAAESRVLFVAGRESPLVRSARDEGGLVLDARQAEGRTIADAFVAIDLDLWERWLADARDVPDANRALARAGARWRLRIGTNVGAPRVLDLPRSRLVLLDSQTLEGAGTSDLVAHAAARIGLSHEQRSRLATVLPGGAR